MQPGPNPVTGKAAPGAGYAPATVAHTETVVRGFYEFHLVNRLLAGALRGPHEHAHLDGEGRGVVG